MDRPAQIKAAEVKAEDIRDLQARLYREIGISAVAAALRAIAQPEPGSEKAPDHHIPAFLKPEDMAA